METKTANPETGAKAERSRAARNRTLTVRAEERPACAACLTTLTGPVETAAIEGKIINQDFYACAGFLPESSVDLLIVDPPYNLTKEFGQARFTKLSSEKYRDWFEDCFLKLLPVLKPTASVYVCCDWQCSSAIHSVLEEHLIVRNRITWEREKGRGAQTNWKNSSEDIWYCTVSNDFFFDVEAVKVRRRVVAPYRDAEGKPKDWQETEKGNFRLTHPGNLWTDITVPFWSMPENTDHPTQKPEKLLAKLILASSRPGDFVFDPFLGSGSTAVTAAKLDRRYSGIEIDTEFCLLAAKRLQRAARDKSIQGYEDGVFWERNAAPKRTR